MCVSGAPDSGCATLADRLRTVPDLRLEAVHSCDVCIIVADANDAAHDVERRAAAACAAGARHLVLAVDRLDLLAWDRSAYARLAAAFEEGAARFGAASALALPTSAPGGDNVETRSTHTPWYPGPPLIAHLEGLNVDPERELRPLRLPISAVTRQDPDRRRYLGTIASGTLRAGDKVKVAVSGLHATVVRIIVDAGERAQAVAGEAVAVELAEHIDIGGGDVLADPTGSPQIAEQVAARLVWMGKEPLLPGRDYTLRLGTREITASVTTLKHRIDIDTLRHDAARTLQAGEIGAVTIAATAPLAVDAFAEFPHSGRFVLCERHSDSVVAAGTIDFALRRGVNVHMQPLAVSKSVRSTLKGQRPCIVWLTGLSGAGKSTIANLVEARLAAEGWHTYLLDGDNVRHGLNKDLGFTPTDRVENIRRVGEVARLFVDAGLIVLCSFISPFRAERAAVRELVGNAEFLEIFVNAPLDVCERRDPKGLYAKSRAGQLPNFTGIDSPYEPPERPDLVLDSAAGAAEELVERVIDLLRERGIVAPTHPART